jgi:hypothetical protein
LKGTAFKAESRHFRLITFNPELFSLANIFKQLLKYSFRNVNKDQMLSLSFTISTDKMHWQSFHRIVMGINIQLNFVTEKLIHFKQEVFRKK